MFWLCEVEALGALWRMPHFATDVATECTRVFSDDSLLEILVLGTEGIDFVAKAQNVAFINAKRFRTRLCHYVVITRPLNKQAGVTDPACRTYALVCPIPLDVQPPCYYKLHIHSLLPLSADVVTRRVLDGRGLQTDPPNYSPIRDILEEGIPAYQRPVDLLYKLGLELRG